MISAGIDCGAKFTKAVILRDGKIIGKDKVLTGFDRERAVEDCLKKAVRAAGISRPDIQRIGGTGAGKKSIALADEEVNDIIAMSKAAAYFFPTARTVVDVGAEEGRAARIDENGNPIDSVVNERCAAGAGTFVEAMARALEVTIEEMGLLSLQSGSKIPINAQCVIFAESEVVGLLHAKTKKSDISRAIHDAMAGHIASMIRRIGVNPDLVVLGGVAGNPGFMAALRRELKIDSILVPDEPEYGAAVGAAVVAAKAAGH
jgi:benzoyl-CoA reductase subunit D